MNDLHQDDGENNTSKLFSFQRVRQVVIHYVQNSAERIHYGIRP